MKKKIMYSTFLCAFLMFVNLYVEYYRGFFDNEKIIMRGLFIIILYAFLVFLNIKGYENGLDIIFNNRYKIAFALFLFCVVFELNGSSLANWNKCIPNEDNISNGVILGIPRLIRSDEWAVNTPMLLSQYFNKFGYFSDIIRGTSTDTFIVYGQPVYDIGVIFRPFHWGYLFLNAGRGLAFFWYGRLIALFVVTFEFGLLITKKNRKLALLLSILTSFAPVIQWWFAINGLVEMFIFGQLAIIMIMKYIDSNNYLYKFFYLSTIFVCAGGYILTFYPSWQIPLFYVFMGIFIWIIWERHREIKISFKDIGIFLILCIFFGTIMMHVLLKSKDTINIVMNTAYPGKRFEHGGGAIEYLVNYVMNIFLPYKNSNLPLNECEHAVFIDFFPIGIIFAINLIFIEKKRDKLLICILISNFILLLWCLFSWPDMVAKISLLSNSQPKRAFLAVGYTNILLIIRSLALKEKFMSIRKSVVFSFILSAIIVLASKSSYGNYANKIMLIISFLIFGVLYIGVINFSDIKIKNRFLIMTIIIMMLSGMTVNPIQKGVDVIYNNKLIQEIENINNKENGKWIVEGAGFPAMNYPLLAGAPTINSTNVYPAIERWNEFDSNSNDNNIYNRYAHISINLQNSGVSKFSEGITVDQFTLDLNVEDLKKLDVKYIMTSNDLTVFSTNNIEFQKIYDTNNIYKIYKVVNKE
ncbi:DUF7657 domain-containing protein [Clostridium neonatale]|uniref:DUF7657 domain-containing protein n=1 Tax=Clostridium neonatale TaxID=137838 RepID=UPI003D352BCC